MSARRFLDVRLLFAQTLVQPKMAYKKAKENASKGYDPNVSAMHAQEYSTAKLAFWVNVPLFSLLALLAFPVSIFWNVPLFLMFHGRLKNFAAAPPDQQARYRIPTWLLITLWIVGLLVSLVGWLIVLASSPTPGVQ